MRPGCDRRLRILGPTLAIAARVVLWSPAALAWDKDGHEAIGMTTMSALQNGPTAQVKRLMGGKDAVDVAAWAHKVNKKYPWTVELHFQRQPGYRCSGVDLTQCPGNRCLTQALKHFYGHLVNKPTANIDWPSNMKLTDADRVKYLINLMGDLHQPLHFGFDTDDMGRNVTVTFRGKSVSLYDFWDGELTQAVMKDSPGFWWGGWTHVQRTRSEYEKDSARWKKDGAEMIDKWAEESAKFACDDVYRNPTTGRRLVPETGNDVIRVDDNLFETWKREMFSRMLTAGARTAIVLNSVLQQREVTKLRGGTAVKELEDEEDDSSRKVPKVGRKADIPRGHKPVHATTALLTNLLIFVVVFGLFLALMRLWTERDPVCQADRAKVRCGDGGKKV